jgi:uncharacterized membrane protein YphA (DoxX/SURF4 family)
MQKAVACTLTALRIGVGVVLVYAMVAKLRAPGDFAQDIANYRILPAALVPIAAAALPGIEAVLGGALVLGLWTRAAAWAAAALLGVFSAGVAGALARGLNIECGCFGATGQPATWWTFARDLALVGAAALVAWRGRE